MSKIENVEISENEIDKVSSVNVNPTSKDVLGGTLRIVDGPNEPETLCRLCFHSSLPDSHDDESSDSEEEEEESNFNLSRLGPLYEYITASRDEQYLAHYFCLLFSSGLDQTGEDHEGILGFLPPNILKEWRRGQRLKCSYCEKKYATVGCGQKSCRKTYHVPCAIKNDCLLQFCDNFQSFCHEHKPAMKKVDKDAPCGICLKIIGSKCHYVGAPCCSRWFHFKCIDRFAKTSGYFFKCPLCNNKAVFEEAMKRSGIYVPEQDAAWEKDEDAFQSLLMRHDSCDAENCVCPHGRKHDIDDTPWEILLCHCCGARGIHVGCLKKTISCKIEEFKWKCDMCKDVVKKMPPTLINVYEPVAKRKKVASETKANLDLLDGFSFRIGKSGILEAFENYEPFAKLQLNPHLFQQEQCHPSFGGTQDQNKDIADSEVTFQAPHQRKGQKTILGYFTHKN